MNNDVVKGIVGTLVVLLIVGMFALSFTTAPVNREISSERYLNLKTELNATCPEMKPIVALYLEQYKFISEGKMMQFLRECDGFVSARIKRDLVNTGEE